MIPAVAPFIAIDAPIWMDACLMVLIAGAVFSASYNIARFGWSPGRTLVWLGWNYMGMRFTIGFVLFGELQITISGMPALFLLAGGTLACAIERSMRSRRDERDKVLT